MKVCLLTGCDLTQDLIERQDQESLCEWLFQNRQDPQPAGLLHVNFLREAGHQNDRQIRVTQPQVLNKFQPLDSSRFVIQKKDIHSLLVDQNESMRKTL